MSLAIHFLLVALGKRNVFLLSLIIQLLFTKHKLWFHTPSLKTSFQEGQSTGPPPLIPGLGQQGAQGRIPPLNPGQGPGPNKGKYLLAG